MYLWILCPIFLKGIQAVDVWCACSFLLVSLADGLNDREYWTRLLWQVITGYLLAGSAIGPGGLSFISELVQVVQSFHASLHFDPFVQSAVVVVDS